jgi:hypothetical protein
MRSLEGACQSFAEAVAKNDLRAVQRLFPGSESTQWAGFFAQYEVLSALPSSDFRLENNTGASCAFSIVVADRGLLRKNRRLATANAQTIRYTVQLSARGDTWIVELVTGV